MSSVDLCFRFVVFSSGRLYGSRTMMLSAEYDNCTGILQSTWTASEVYVVVCYPHSHNVLVLLTGAGD
jgi:hypothetical protein